MNINYMEEAENYFIRYADLKRAILHAKQNTDNFSQREGETDHAVKTPDELKKWQEFHSKSKDEIDHVEELLSALNNRERKMLVLYYIKQLSVPNIMQEMHLRTEQAVYNLKNKALKDFSITMFGVCALRNDLTVAEAKKKKDFR